MGSCWLFPLCCCSVLIRTFHHLHTHTLTLFFILTSWLLLLGLLSDSFTREDLMSARSPSSSEWLSSAKICSLCGSPSSLNGIISSVAHSSGSPPPPDNWGIFICLLVCLFKQEISEWNSRNGAGETSSFLFGKTVSHLEGGRRANTLPVCFQWSNRSVAGVRDQPQLQNKTGSQKAKNCSAKGSECPAHASMSWGEKKKRKINHELKSHHKFLFSQHTPKANMVQLKTTLDTKNNIYKSENKTFPRRSG